MVAIGKSLSTLTIKECPEDLRQYYVPAVCGYYLMLFIFICLHKNFVEWQRTNHQGTYCTSMEGTTLFHKHCFKIDPFLGHLVILNYVPPRSMSYILQVKWCMFYAALIINSHESGRFWFTSHCYIMFAFQSETLSLYYGGFMSFME